LQARRSPYTVIQTVIFLKLSIAGRLTLFVARTKRPMLTRPFPAPMLLGAILDTQVIAAMIAGFGILITPIPWSYIGLIWVYCLIGYSSRINPNSRCTCTCAGLQRAIGAFSRHSAAVCISTTAETGLSGNSLRVPAMPQTW
jgi:hypothetical protein